MGGEYWAVFSLEGVPTSANLCIGAARRSLPGRLGWYHCLVLVTVPSFPFGMGSCLHAQHPRRAHGVFGRAVYIFGQMYPPSFYFGLLPSMVSRVCFSLSFGCDASRASCLFFPIRGRCFESGICEHRSRGRSPSHQLCGCGRPPWAR